MTQHLALVIGDPAGVGPELMAKLLALPEVRDETALLIIGDRRVLAEGERITGTDLQLDGITDGEIPELEAGRIKLLDTKNADPAKIAPGVASAEGGRSVLENFSLALDLARDGRVDAITYVPFNKEALRLGGNTFDDELSFAAAHLKHDGAVAEFNVVDQIWNARVTSHVPLREVADLITPDRLMERLGLAVRALKEAGFPKPRVAVAALNPHAGDGGAFGREDIDVIGPAIKQAQDWAARDGFVVEGPFPSDTVFLRARAGDYDAVLTMFHDQGQIAIKLMGFDRGVTVLYGLPVAVTTPAHGTAYDIVGKGIANLEPTRRAFMIARKMAASRRNGAAAGREPATRKVS